MSLRPILASFACAVGLSACSMAGAALPGAQSVPATNRAYVLGARPFLGANAGSGVTGSALCPVARPGFGSATRFGGLTHAKFRRATRAHSCHSTRRHVSKETLFATRRRIFGRRIICRRLQWVPVKSSPSSTRTTTHPQNQILQCTGRSSVLRRAVRTTAAFGKSARAARPSSCRPEAHGAPKSRWISRWCRPSVPTAVSFSLKRRRIASRTLPPRKTKRFSSARPSLAILGARPSGPPTIRHSIIPALRLPQVPATTGTLRVYPTTDARAAGAGRLCIGHFGRRHALDTERIGA